MPVRTLMELFLRELFGQGDFDRLITESGCWATLVTVPRHMADPEIDLLWGFEGTGLLG